MSMHRSTAEDRAGMRIVTRSLAVLVVLAVLAVLAWWLLGSGLSACGLSACLLSALLLRMLRCTIRSRYTVERPTHR